MILVSNFLGSTQLFIRNRVLKTWQDAKSLYQIWRNEQASQSMHLIKYMYVIRVYLTYIVYEYFFLIERSKI